jgi:uncharacterized membrane protein
MPQGDPAAAVPAERLETIDAVRGAVMVLMALDHVRDFVHRGAMSQSPTDLATTTPLLFLTRWITHLCAPAFMFTAGLGAYLWWRRGRTRGELATWLVTRGVWLIVLELTVMQVAYYFTLSSRYPVLLLVLWALGACMIGLAALIWLPLRLLAGVSLLVIVLHNTLDGVAPATFGPAAPLWNVLHQPGAFPIAGLTVVVGYPIVPWIAVMALGFCCGEVFLLDRPTRRRRLMMAGAVAMAAFVMLRTLNMYGDPVPWTTQPSAVYTALSFLNTTKYPPSLLFLLMTLGPAVFALGWLDRPALRPTHPLVTFGRVPLFYFVLHFYAAHLAAVLLAIIKYGADALRFVFQPFPSLGGPRHLFPSDFGYGLGATYVVWIAVVLIMYPACRWFMGVRAKRRDWWLRYL